MPDPPHYHVQRNAYDRLLDDPGAVYLRSPCPDDNCTRERVYVLSADEYRALLDGSRD